MITELQGRLDHVARWPVFGWKSLSVAAGLVFTAGSSFAYYSDNIVLQDEFEPVRLAVEAMEGIPKKLDSIEGWLVIQSTCDIYQDTYIRDLADYAAKTRRKPPTMNQAYRDCLKSKPSLGN